MNNKQTAWKNKNISSQELCRRVKECRTVIEIIFRCQDFGVSEHAIFEIHIAAI